jgi:subtilisin-like proprotein convertase family protein
VTIAIVDSGVQSEHPDLKDNYRADLSRDFTETVDAEGNVTPYKDNPTGTYDLDPSPNSSNETHGTESAGVAVAKGNNNIGISGAAPDADLAALKLSGTVNELQIADALSYLNDDIDIYNNSWKVGPFTSVPSAEYQLEAGANQGRDGLGNVYVFSAGNYALQFQDVNQNPLANSRHTIAVAATTHKDTKAIYSEPGSPVFISAPSNGSGAGVLTTDLTGSDGKSEDDYTDDFGGTSAAAPLVSGVVGLMLETNPNLTARDVQHILAESARKDLLANNGLTAYSNDWITNGAGYEVNYHYGFGGVDAFAAVELAANWTPVGKEIKASAAQSPNIAIPDGDATGITPTANISEEFTVEWAEVMVDITHDYRGDLEVVLISPDGTESILANPSWDPKNNYDHWVFTSARHWGESSEGEWKLEVRDEYSETSEISGTLNEWKLNLYGSEPIVSIKATDPDANEGGDPGEFTFYRTGNTKKPLTVTYSIEPEIYWAQPRAINGIEYEEISTSIEIPAGQSSVTLPIKPMEDTVVEWPETVRLKITDTEDYTVSTTDNLDTVVLWDNETPTVQLYGDWYSGQAEDFYQKAYTSESGKTGRFAVRRLGSLEEDLTVYYDLPGTATNGVDYQELPGSITIPAGVHDAGFKLIPIDDEEVEGEETVEVTLTPHPSYEVRHDQDRVSMTIWDNDDKPTISLEATDAIASEYGDSGEFTITRTGDTSNPLTVDYWVENKWGGRATNGLDYQEIPGSIVIPEGESSVKIQIQPIDDGKTEKDENVDIYLKTNPLYAISSQQSARVIIDDNETPSIAWQKQLGTPEYDHANAVATDSTGNVYTTGRTTGNLAGTNAGLGDAFVNKFDDNGNLLWQRQLGTSGYDEANGMSVDDAGNVYLTGWTDGAFDGNTSDRDPWIANTTPTAI